MKGRKWTDQEVEKVKELILSGMSYTAIGERFGTTRSAISGLADRRNLNSSSLGLDQYRNNAKWRGRKTSADGGLALREMIKANPKLTGRLPIHLQQIPAFGSKTLPVSKIAELKMEYRPKNQPRPQTGKAKRLGRSKWE